MGSGRDKRKKQKGKAPGVGAEKTAKKTLENELKAQRRAEKRTEGDDDLDVLLAQFKIQDERQQAPAVEEDVPPPSPRSFASFTAIPGQKEERIIMFGGEFYDNAKDTMSTFNDLYVYTPATDSWTRLQIPKGPSPRNAHQAVYHKSYLYIFGGELTSTNMENFRHFKELWRLDVNGQTWEQLPVRGGPAARSGHRMAVWKNQLLLFGGFQDTGKVTKYFNDLWTFDIEDMKWEPFGPSDASGPGPRGGGGLVLHGDTLFVYGGHVVLPGKKGSEEKDKMMDDFWALDLNSQKWDKLKKEGMAPAPRMSFGFVTHKKRAILFGGITDQKGRGDRVYSETYNELYHFNMEMRRWFPLALRVPRQPKAEAQGVGPAPGVEAQEGEKENALGAGALDKDSALYRAAVRIQSRYRGYVVRKAYTTYKLGGTISELLYSPAAYGIDLSSQHLLKPRARANPMMTVCGNSLYLMGGLVEVEDHDVTLDDIWTLDLVKLDGWKCVRENTSGDDLLRSGEWATDDDEDEDEDHESDDGEGSKGFFAAPNVPAS